jgi:hypothetical protein
LSFFVTSFPKSRHRYVVQTGLFSRNVCTPSPATAYTKRKRFTWLKKWLKLIKFTGLKKWLKLIKFTGLTILQANLVKNNHTKIKGALFLFLINSFKNMHTFLLLFFLILLFHIFLLSSFSASSFSLPHSPSPSSSFLSPPPHSSSPSLSSLKIYNSSVRVFNPYFSSYSFMFHLMAPAEYGVEWQNN